MVLLVEVALLVWEVVLLGQVYLSKIFRIRRGPPGGCPWVDRLIYSFVMPLLILI